jgi:hypothetical protein
MECQRLINIEIKICAELKQAGLNIIVVTETNKKFKGAKGNGGHLMTCSRLPQEERAVAGLPTLVDKKCNNKGYN